MVVICLHAFFITNHGDISFDASKIFQFIHCTSRSTLAPKIEEK